MSGFLFEDIGPAACCCSLFATTKRVLGASMRGWLRALNLATLVLGRQASLRQSFMDAHGLVEHGVERAGLDLPS